MKQLIFILIIGISTAITVSGQTSILKKFNFEKGKWKLFGFSGKSDLNTPLQDSLGDFYTNDREVLKSMQKSWMLKKHKDRNCETEMKLVFIQNDTVEYPLRLNLNCRRIWGDLGTYEFPESMLRQFYPKLKHIPRTEYEAGDLQTARKLYKYLLSNDSARLVSGDYDYRYWTKFSGFMSIQVIDSIVNNYAKFDKLVTNKIKADYPNEIFEIEKGWSSYSPKEPDIYNYYIYCSQTMGNNFKTFKTSEKWEAFGKQIVIIYGLTESQITEIVKTLE